MEKARAIELLGGTTAAAAEAVGVSHAAISQWPQVLPPRLADRVQAALWRIANGVPHPKPAETTPEKASA